MPRGNASINIKYVILVKHSGRGNMGQTTLAVSNVEESLIHSQDPMLEVDFALLDISNRSSHSVRE